MPEYSDMDCVRQVVELMNAHGVTQCVLCPGSRNSPLVKTLSQHENMECRAATDERSAAFMALGWASQTRQPVALCLTSGSALLNAHAAVAEAHYRNIPLLVLSADRPTAWLGQQDGQTLPQKNVFGSLVACSVELPEGSSNEQSWHRNRLINEALLCLRHRGGAPAHINIPLGEKLFGKNSEALEPQRIIRRTEFASMGGQEEEEILDITRALPRRMILIGQTPQPPELISALKEKGFVVIAEHLGNAQAIDGAITRPDLALGAECSAEFAPDLLISLGGCIISKRLKRLLRQNPPSEHWHVSPKGEIIDTFCCLTRVLEGSEEELFDLLEAFIEYMDEGSTEHLYSMLWHEAAEAGAAACPALNAMPWGGPRAVGELLAALPSPATLHLANSSAVRYAQMFPLAEGIHVECNRGTNGIEGSLSSAIGYAAAEPTRPNVLIIGDLSFFYDMNALWLPALSANLHIILLNNGCGGIFSTLPLGEDAVTQEYVMAKHQQSAAAWAQACGLEYRALRSAQSWAPDFTSTRATLTEIFTDAAADAQTYRQFFNTK